MKNKTISQLKAEADKSFSIFIRERDGYECITCGRKSRDETEYRYFHAGHYISRSHLILRYDERNVSCQCYGCNIGKSGNYPVYALKMIEKHGDNILFELDEIIKKSQKEIKKYGKEFYQSIIDKYKT